MCKVLRRASLSVCFTSFLLLVSRLEQSLSEKYGYFILRIHSLAGIMSMRKTS